MEIEEVWARLKETARDYAREGKRLNRFTARALVEDFVQAAQIYPWPRDEVMEFYSRELREMTAAHLRTAIRKPA